MTNNCKGCDICCREFTINVFPSVAKKIANKLKINYKEFVNKYLDLYFEFYTIPDRLYNDEFIELPENLENEFSGNVVLFVSMSLKKKNGVCTFLENHNCSIYSFRPFICQMFPKVKFYGESYSFCKLDSEEIEASVLNKKVYFKILKDYLKSINKKGFKYTWKYIPNFENKVVLLDSKPLKIKEETKKYLKYIISN